MRILLLGSLFLVGCTTVEVQANPTTPPTTAAPTTAVPSTTAPPDTAAPVTAPTTVAPATTSPIVSSDPSDRSISASEWDLILSMSNADQSTPIDRAVPFISIFCDAVEQVGFQEARQRSEATFDEGDVPQVGRDLTYNGAAYYCLDVLTANP